MCGLIPKDLKFFLQHSRYGNFKIVRTTAMDAIILLDGLNNRDIVVYLFKLIQSDPDPFIKFHLSQALWSFANIATSFVAESEFINRMGFSRQMILDLGIGSVEKAWVDLKALLNKDQEIRALLLACIK